MLYLKGKIMIEVIYIYKRRSKETNFFDKPVEIIDYITNNYGDKLLYSENNLSEDSLVLTRSAIWTSLEDFHSFQNDEKLADFRAASRQHNIENKINVTCKINETKF